jgi:heme O synthase-like polyprenyltransferase
MFTRSRRHARWAFFVSLIYLPTVFALMLIDQV